MLCYCIVVCNNVYAFLFLYCYYEIMPAVYAMYEAVLQYASESQDTIVSVR